MAKGAPAMIMDPAWTAIGSNAWLGLPIIIWIVLALFLFNHILLSRTTFGRRTYLTGGNREAAVYSGIKVDRLKITIFTLSGVMAAISGILLSSICAVLLNVFFNGAKQDTASVIAAAKQADAH